MPSPCPSAPPPSRSAHITADTDPHQTAALRLPQIYIRKHLYHSPGYQMFMNYLASCMHLLKKNMYIPTLDEPIHNYLK